MMNASCIAGCLDDVVHAQEERRRNGNRSKWAKESDKEFLMRMLATNREEADSSSSPSPSPLRRTEHTDFHDSYACCRQRYLRSYIFTRKKPTAAQRTKNWIKEKKKNLKASDENLKGRTCSFTDSCLKVLLLCVAKVDGHEY